MLIITKQSKISENCHISLETMPKSCRGHPPQLHLLWLRALRPQKTVLQRADSATL